MIRLVAALMLILTTAAQAQNFLPQSVVDEANVAMWQRRTNASEQFAQRLGAPSALVTFCELELGNYLRQLPTDGSFPFGVDYRRIPSRDYLTRLMTVRETFETMHIRICIARSFNTLRDAEVPARR